MKTLDEFVEMFAELFDETDSNVFSPDTDYRELDEWSSLIGLSLIAMVDEEFGVALKANDFRSVTTIEDVYNTILSKL
ncbi:MAG: acyl carrier protein [Prevotella sp.]|nr:acyl carrier protein [Prevotella sp.]